MSIELSIELKIKEGGGKTEMKKIGIVVLITVLLMNIFLVSVSADSQKKIIISIQEKTISNRHKALLAFLIISLFLCKEKEVEVICQPGRDPTLGRVENNCDFWKILFYIDEEVVFVLLPGEKRNLHLDIGRYSIRAEAYVETFFGERLAGVFKKNLRVNFKMLSGEYRNLGWRISLVESNFMFKYP